MDAADAGLAIFAVVGEEEDATLLGGGVEGIETGAERGRSAEAGSVEEDVVDLLAELGGEDGFDFAEGAVGGFGELRATPGFDHAGSEDEGGDFFAVKHEGRDIEIAAEGVADAGFAGDGHAGELQVLDIAIDGAMGDLQLFGQAARGLQTAAAEQLHDAEETVGAAHASL